MSKTVLIVDDSEFMREVVKQVLELINFSFETAENGKEALEKIRSSNFDLVITDINMPVVDGITLIQEIRKINSNLPILVLTTESEEKTRKEAMQNGANGWITKPFEAVKLLNLIKEFTD